MPGLYAAAFREAVDHYWTTRNRTAGESEGAYGGRRAEVVGGKQLDGFLVAIGDVLIVSGVPEEWLFWQRRGGTTIPGWFRATKSWDLLIVEPGAAKAEPRLHGAIELKVLGGPSFGNNANNRAEEAIGNAVDLWKAYREGGYRAWPEPFVGYVIMVEDAPKSTAPVKVTEPHFPVFPEFESTSYVERMCLLCERLMAERLYHAACVIVSGMETLGQAVNYSEPSAAVGVERFFETLLRMVRPLG